MPALNVSWEQHRMMMNLQKTISGEERCEKLPIIVGVMIVGVEDKAQILCKLGKGRLCI